MIGSLLLKELKYRGYRKIITKESDQLDLRNQNITTKFSYIDVADKIDGLSDPHLKDAVGQIPADYIKISPVQYEINMPDNCDLEGCRYLVTSIPYSNSWSAGDHKQDRKSVV